MVKIIKFEDIVKKDILEWIKDGKVFIYPTDTIYGLGCNALDKDAVDKIRRIKRSLKPFSVIAPSRKWIFDNLKVKNKKYIKKGAYTFILEIKKKCVYSGVNVRKKTLGVRLPDHEFIRFIKVPFITTSVNLSGSRNIVSVKKIPKRILGQVDYVVDGGVLDNKPSTIIDLTAEIPMILSRKKYK